MLGRGRVRCLDVAGERPAHPRLLKPLLLVSNGAFAAWALSHVWTAEVRWQPPADRLLQLAAATGRPLIYYAWHAYSWLSISIFKHFPDRAVPAILAHDGWLSRLNQDAYAWVGFPVWVYCRNSPTPPRTQIADALLTYGGHLALAADSGGPYGRVRSGLLEIAQNTNAFLVPLTVRGHGIVRLTHPVAHYVALPFCSLFVYTGEPLDGRQLTEVAQCQQALDHLEQQHPGPASGPRSVSGSHIGEERRTTTGIRG